VTAQFELALYGDRMSEFAANWYPDPNGRAELRYWDGAAWTDHISNGGVQGSDPLTAGGEPAAPKGVSKAFDKVDSALTVGNEGKNVADQVGGTGYRGAGIQGVAGGGTGSIFSEPVLVVNQKAKLIELNNQYSIFDQNGQQIAAVEQVGQGAFRKFIRFFGSLDQFFTTNLEVRDAGGRVLMGLTRPGKIFKSKVIVSNPSGIEIGRIVQKNMFGKINFTLESGGQALGAIKGENWRAWNFRIEDAQETEIARVTKTFEGIAKTMFTTADNYVVQVHQRAGEPLNTLVVASALSIDTALKQDARGFGA